MSILEEELELICDEADIGLGKKSLRKILGNEDVKTFQDLINHAQILDPDKGSEKDLLKVIDWAKDFRKINGRDPVLTEGGDFNEDTFQEFKKKNSTVEIATKHLSKVYHVLKDEQEITELVREQNLMPKIQEEIVQRFDENDMTAQLKDAVGKFDYKGLTSHIVRAAYPDNHIDAPTDREALVFLLGQMQTGKSSVKAAAALAANSVNLASIITTKGVPESKQLVTKLRDYLGGTKLEGHVVGLRSLDVDGAKRAGKNKIREIEDALKNRGVVVLADTASQMQNVTRVVESFQAGGGDFEFVLMVDECDAVVLRTSDRHTKIEQAYDELVSLKPTVSIMVSATPVPMMLEVAFGSLHENMLDPTIFNIEPREEYCGVTNNMIQPLKDAEGKRVHLDPKQVTHHNLYMSDTDALLWRNAVEDKSKEGVLVLDCTNPRVRVAGNIREKAEYVQEWCKGEHGRDVVVMVIIGNGIDVRHLTADENGQLVRCWIMADKGKNVDGVIEELDGIYGLETPVFCFGFSKMTRGCSFRSSLRVPTHMILSLGTGHHVMNYVQALGRATGNGRSVLIKNGYQAVTILTAPQDYIMAKKVLTFVDELFKSIQQGATFREALTGAKEAIPDAANFIRHTARKISRIPAHKGMLQSANFETPSADFSEEEIVVKEKFFHESYPQKVLRCICESTHKDGTTEFCLTDLQEAFDDTFLDDGLEIRTPKLRKIIKDFVDAAVIQKLERWEDADKSWYSVDSPRRILGYLNKSVAMTQAEISDGDSLEHALGFDGSLAPSEETDGSSDTDSCSDEEEGERARPEGRRVSSGEEEADSSLDDEEEGGRVRPESWGVQAGAENEAEPPKALRFSSPAPTRVDDGNEARLEALPMDEVEVRVATSTDGSDDDSSRVRAVPVATVTPENSQELQTGPRLSGSLVTDLMFASRELTAFADFSEGATHKKVRGRREQLAALHERPRWLFEAAESEPIADDDDIEEPQVSIRTGRRRVSKRRFPIEGFD